MTRAELEAELKALVSVEEYRAIFLRAGDAELAATVARFRAERERVNKIGHIAATGLDLRKVG